MKILIATSAPMDGSGYLAAILHAFGICFAERSSLRDALAAADPHRDLLLLPHGSETTGVESFLQAGGTVVAIRPAEALETLAGISRKGEHSGPSRLRIVQPVCYGARGEPLWTLGSITVYENTPSPHVVGYLFQPGEWESESPGILENAVGSGQLITYAYDPVLCVARLRQGYPERANLLPAWDTTPRPYYLHHPNPPPDTSWRPTADLHCAAFCEIILRSIWRRAPVPTLWHIPEGRAGLLLFTGDEDGAVQEANQKEMLDLEASGGVLSLFVIPENTSITRQQMEEYTRRGHTVSVHPDLMPTRGQSPSVQLARAEQQVRLFREKFQWPVRTVRHHCTMWPGYLDLPELWERLGIGMDSSVLAGLVFQSPDGGPYVNVDAAMPLPFVRENGRLIDVYEQPIHLSDDVTCHPTVNYSQKFSAAQFEWIARRMFEDATRFFHAPFCACIHPGNYATYSREQGRSLMSVAREFEMPIWSLDRWHDFWRARASWRMTEHSWDGVLLRCSFKGTPCEQLCLTLPAHAGSRMLRSLQIGGSSVAFRVAERYGRRVVLASVPPERTEVAVEARYEQPNTPAA